MPELTSGAVLGIDVGFSPRRPTTCYCLLRWTQSTVDFSFALVRADPIERRDKLRELLQQESCLDGSAIDGPLAHGLQLVNRYRSAEAILSRGELQRRGKPGQTNSPTGQLLHQH